MKPLRPYLYHAYYHWIVDNGNTPYLLVNSEYPDVCVPQEFVQDGKIILNVSPRSVGQYEVNDESISFSTRFQGVIREVYIPFGAAEAVYAQESGEGVMFQPEDYYSETAYLARRSQKNREKVPLKKPTKTSGHLKLVK